MPQPIDPVVDNPKDYAGWSCEELGDEQIRLLGELSAASDEEVQARQSISVDALPIMVVVSSLSGSRKSSRINQLMGELEVLQAAITDMDCGIKMVPIYRIIQKDVRYNPDVKKERVERWVIIPGPMHEDF